MITNKYKLNKHIIWSVMCLPAIYTLTSYWMDTISYGQVIHQTGDWSVAFLCLALAVTPLRKLLPKVNWPKWLMTQRRAIGVASFAYAAIHTLTYLERKWGYGYIQTEFAELGMLTGWIALFIFLVLAITSNNKSISLLRKNWQRLHRTVYLAAGLTFAHWVLTAFDPQIAYICLAVVCAIQALRFKKRA